jgi:hypothetical protein
MFASKFKFQQLNYNSFFTSWTSKFLLQWSATWGQCYKTFYRGNLPPFDGIADILFYKTSLLHKIVKIQIEWL